MTQFQNHPKDTFSEWYRSLNGSLMLFGLALVTFAILIFMFPALIGILFAAFIFMIGGTVLWAAWKMHRFKNHINTSNRDGNGFYGTVRTEGPHFTHRRFTWIIR